ISPSNWPFQATPFPTTQYPIRRLGRWRPRFSLSSSNASAIPILAHYKECRPTLQKSVSRCPKYRLARCANCRDCWQPSLDMHFAANSVLLSHFARKAAEKGHRYREGSLNIHTEGVLGSRMQHLREIEMRESFLYLLSSKTG